MIKKDYLKILNKSNKPFIIYKSNKGFDLYTNFSKKIILTDKNINNFISRISKCRYENKSTDLYIGFFGYEILNNLIGVKIPKQIGFKFPKGIFYKPELKVKLKNRFEYKSNEIIRLKKKFKVNINRKNYTNIFNRLLKDELNIQILYRFIEKAPLPAPISSHFKSGLLK